MRFLTYGLILMMILSVAIFYSACGEDEKESKADYGAGDGLCAACENAVPYTDDLKISIPGDDENTTKVLGEMAEYYHITVDISRGLNYWILAQLGWLDEILSYPPTESDDEACTWGPFIPSGLSPVEVKFVMAKVAENDFVYSWDERLKNTEDDFVSVWSGSVTPSSSTNRRGVGDLVFDYTTAKMLDPTIDLTGTMTVNYDTYTDGREIDIVFEDFMSDYDEYPTDATYHYHNRDDNSGEFEFTYFANVNPGYPELETISHVTNWMPSGAGVSTATISGGDLGSEHDDFVGMEGYECWDELFKRTYFKETLHLTSGDQVTSEEGDIEDCVF